MRQQHKSIIIGRAMRSSLRSNNLISHSQISNLGSMSVIRSGTNFPSKEAKFLLADEIGNFAQKLFGKEPILEKDINDLRKIGYSYRKYENGDCYYGQMDGDKPAGQGVYVFTLPDKQKFYYKGNFENGEFNGLGKLCKVINDKQGVHVYQGSWKNGKKWGEGKEDYNGDNNLYYKGGYVNNQRHGQGVLVMPEGSYDGTWENDRMHGKGVFTLERGPIKKVVIGQWVNDTIPYGEIKYFSKSNQPLGEYKGGIKDLVREGEGQYSTGTTILEGVFKNDDLVGPCKMKKSDPQYEYLLTGDLHQSGPYQADIKYLGSGDMYKGAVDISPNNLMLRTKGKYYFANGNNVEGEFVDNDRGDIVMKQV